MECDALLEENNISTKKTQVIVVDCIVSAIVSGNVECSFLVFVAGKRYSFVVGNYY